MAEILLVEPNTGWFDAIKTHPDMPLGLLSAARYVYQDYKVKLIDQRVDKDWKIHLLEELKKKPICVGITSMTGIQIKHGLAVSEIVKEHEIPVVWGGVHPTILPRQTLTDERVDIVIQDEGEISFHELVKNLEKGQSLKGVKGVWYKEDRKIKVNPVREYINLDEAPSLPYELVNIKDYEAKYFNTPTIGFESTRGCPFRCTFCRNTITTQTRWRAMSSEKTLNEIKMLIDNYSVKGIHFVDDNFFVNLKRSKEIIHGMKDFGIPWLLNSIRIDTLDRIDSEQLKLLVDSKCMQLKIGVESGSQKILDMIKKDITVEQVLRVNEKLKKYNISAMYNFMCGFPHETKEDLQKTVDLMFALYKGNKNATTSAVNIYTPYPGTEMFDEIIKLGFKEPESLEEWSKHSFETIDPTWLSPEHKELSKSLFFTSLFLAGFDEEFIGSPVLRGLITLYRPIAKFRTKRLFFKFLLEPKIKEMFVDYYSKK